jgi:CubicO group peptidase (beta-lactamase class C family)
MMPTSEPGAEAAPTREGLAMSVVVRSRRCLGLVVVAAWSAAVAGGVLEARPGRDLATASPESVGVSTERLKRLDAGMKGLVDDGRLAGIVTMLVRRGKTAYFSAHGKKDIGAADPMTRDAIFRIYSMTKPVTGVALMMLYEEGKWRLDDPVARHIPAFAKLKVYTGENPDGTLALEDARRSMTMRELMTHTGGLAYGLVGSHPVDRLFVKANLMNPAAPLQTMVDGIAGLPLLAQPGTRWSYSIGVDVQGYLVEKLSGMSFAQFLQTRLFTPLGMKDTAFHVPAEKLTRLARMHGEDAKGTLIATDRQSNPTVVPQAAFGGHGLFSTAADYARFCQMLLDGGEFGGSRVLAPRSVEMLRTNHVLAEPLKTMRQGLGWGLGAQVVTDAAAAGEPYSDGSLHWWGIGGTWFWIDPAKDMAFIGMIQHQGRTLLSATQIHGYARNLAYQTLVD